MGTRGAIGFVVDGEWKVTYNHFDSYPEGLGMEVLEFCKSVEDWDRLKNLAKKVKLVDEDNKPTESNIKAYSKYADLSVSSQSIDDWYCLLRSTQGVTTLEEIYKGNLKHMIDSHLFLANSLFCEWAYIIDLDEMTLNVYKGFNLKSQKDVPLPPDIDPSKYDPKGFSGEKYYPVKFLYAYKLDKLPEFMLGVTNEFKKEYRKQHPDNLVQALERLE